MIDTSRIFRNQNTAALEAMRTAYSVTDASKTTETGRAMGMTLKVVEDPIAELMDSMEEISMMFEEKATREIQNRRVGQSEAMDMMLMDEQEEEALEDMVARYREVCPDIPSADEITKYLEAVRSMMRGGAGGLDELLKKLDDMAKDPLAKFATLEILEKQTSVTDPELSRMFRSMRQQIFAQNKDEIRAGINLAGTIREQATSPEQVKELRNLYRQEVLGFSSPQACFRSLLAQKGLSGIAGSLQFLLQSCGIDMQSAHPSRSMTELARILSDLQCVDVLTTVMEQAESLAARTMAQFSEKGVLQGDALVEHILSLTEKPFVTPETIAQFIATSGVQQLLAQIYFLTGMIGLFRKLSPRLFEDESGRERMVDSAQEHLDGLVERQAEKDEEDAREGAKGGRG